MLLRLTMRVSGSAVAKVASEPKSLYVTAYEADPAVLDEIFRIVSG